MTDALDRSDAVREVDQPWRALPAAQQPQWHRHPALAPTEHRLRASDPLVDVQELRDFTEAMAAVASGEASLIQLGDCAESFSECTPGHTVAKAETLAALAEDLTARTGTSTVRVGRLAGQFAKPRSNPVEVVDGQELQVFRGHMVNSELPTPAARSHDPRRMLRAYEASRKVMRHLAEGRRHRGVRATRVVLGPWSSHEALVVDYESSFVRHDPDTGAPFLGSTHMPWIGERTRDPDSAIARLLAEVTNPVGVKIGPTASAAALLRLGELLDPGRLPGRLTVIVRMGQRAIRDVLPGLVDALVGEGHPAIFVSDPMHGNTVTAGSGAKTRHLSDVVAEVEGFVEVVRGAGQHPGGLHLEVAAGDVAECVGGNVASEEALDACSRSLCDPRLNPVQARAVLDAWSS